MTTIPINYLLHQWRLQVNRISRLSYVTVALAQWQKLMASDTRQESLLQSQNTSRRTLSSQRFKERKISIGYIEERPPVQSRALLRYNAFLRESRRRLIAIYDSLIDVRAFGKSCPGGIIRLILMRRSRWIDRH